MMPLCCGGINECSIVILSIIKHSGQDNWLIWKVIMGETKAKQPTAAQKFWDAFRSCVEDNRVGSRHTGYYVRWAQAFFRFIPGKGLRDRSREDIEAFLSDLGKRSGTGDWQVWQAVSSQKKAYLLIRGMPRRGGITSVRTSCKKLSKRR